MKYVYLVLFAEVAKQIDIIRVIQRSVRIRLKNQRKKVWEGLASFYTRQPLVVLYRVP